MWRISWYHKMCNVLNEVSHKLRSLQLSSTVLSSQTPSMRITPMEWESIKGKAVLLQAWSGPEGSRKLRFQDFMTTAQVGGKVVSLKHRPSLPTRNPPGTHFCQRLSWPQGHSAIGRIMSRKNTSDTFWDQTSDLRSEKPILIIKPTRCTNFSNLFLE